MLGKSSLRPRREFLEAKNGAKKSILINLESDENDKICGNIPSSDQNPRFIVTDVRNTVASPTIVGKETIRKRAQDLQKLYASSKKQQYSLSCDSAPIKVISNRDVIRNVGESAKKSVQLSPMKTGAKTTKSTIGTKNSTEAQRSIKGEKPKEGFSDFHKSTSLKDVIRKSNENFLRSMESEYASSDKRTSTTALILADVYLAGKRANRDTERAIQILCDSTLSEAKYKLIRLGIDTANYADAFHLGKYFNCISCKGPVVKLRGLIVSKKAENAASINSKFIPSNVIRPLEGAPKYGLKHRSETLINSIFDIIGESEAIKFRRQGTSKGYSLQSIPE